MYSLFNSKMFINLILCAIIILIQAYSPKISLSDNLNVSLDLLLIFITFLVLSNKTYYVVFIAFFLGLIQDFIINIEAIGLCSFTKSLSTYYIGKVKLNNSLWSKIFKIIYIFIIYYLHFVFYYFVINFDIDIMILLLSLFHSLSALVVFYFIDRFFFNSNLL